MKRLTFKAFDGKTIHYAEWEVKSPKAVVIICHGMCEHILRYDHFAEALNKAGYLVAGDDHRGHGLTDKDTLGYCDGDMYHDTLKDMNQLVLIYKQKYPDLKIILFSHSYGSFLTQRFIEEYNENLSGVIVGGSANMKGALPHLGKMIANIGCVFKGKQAKAKLINNMTFGTYKKQLKMDSFVSSIKEEADRYDQDPFCNYICSYNFYKCFFTGLTEIYKKQNLAKINLNIPMLVISGDKDPVGGFSKLTTKLYELYKNLGVKYVDLILYKDALHEYLNDISREKAINDILTFIDNVVG